MRHGIPLYDVLTRLCFLVFACLVLVPSPATATLTIPENLSGENAIWADQCEQGDGRACLKLGYSLQHGRDIRQSQEKALEFYIRSCDLEYSNGCHNVGLYMHHGLAGEKDDQAALSFYRRGCEMTTWSAAACNAVGAFYIRGLGGVEINYDQAHKLYQKACDIGQAISCRNIGRLHELGRGGPINLQKAATYYVRACDLKDAIGCNNLAGLYEKGHGNLEKDWAKSVELYQRSCSQGFAYACSNLSWFYIKGTGGLKRDLDAAEALLNDAIRLDTRVEASERYQFTRDLLDRLYEITG